MALLTFRSIRRFAPGALALTLFAALPSQIYSQASPTAPTATQDPNLIDQISQKVSAKYDAPRATILKEVDAVSHQGPFRPDWGSLRNMKPPEWYKDAKFGIFIHWGVYSVPAFANEWYSREMYQQGSDDFSTTSRPTGRRTSLATRTLFPCSRRKTLIRGMGAAVQGGGCKYVVPVAEHHDGFRHVRQRPYRLDAPARWAPSATWWATWQKQFAQRACTSALHLIART